MEAMASPRPTRNREAIPLVAGRGRNGRLRDGNDESVGGARSGWIKWGVILFSLGMVIVSYYAMFKPKRGRSSVHPEEKSKVLARYEDIDMYGHSHSKKKDKKKKNKKKSECEKGDYRKRTLQLAYELPFVALFKERKGQTKFEASSVIVVNDTVYAVCDSSWSISRFADSLTPFGSDNVQIGDPQREEEDSGYEAIFHDGGIFYVVRESIEMGEEYHAVIEELDIQGDDYEVVDACPSEIEFEGDSKGFEGALGIKDLSRNLTILGLCEGNWCSESKKDEKGNGRLIAMSKGLKDDGSCEWKTVREIVIPESAFFTDYSAITMSDDGKVAISSQEDSKIWVGQLNGKNSDGLWDVDKIEFDESEGHVFSFPKNDNCDTVYCNIEGLAWINDDMLLAVSDKMKKKQDFFCFEKDQSVHAFVLP